MTNVQITAKVVSDNYHHLVAYIRVILKKRREACSVKLDCLFITEPFGDDDVKDWTGKDAPN